MFIYKSVIIVIFFMVIVFANPIITVDEPVKDYGPIKESNKTLSFKFKIKNTGTSDLIIQKVKPG